MEPLNLSVFCVDLQLHTPKSVCNPRCGVFVLSTDPPHLKSSLKGLTPPQLTKFVTGMTVAKRSYGLQYF
jgi:hypothetical protein